MKVIDLLNKIANGEIDEEKKYQFSYQDYCSIKEFFNRYIVDEENLNLEIKDNDDLELLPDDELYEFNKYASLDKEHLDFNFRALKDKINEMIKDINEIKKNG